MAKITEEKVQELIKTINKGLVCGIGKPFAGEMCVMHAISVVIEGVEGEDRPTCVNEVIAGFDIILNDQSWSSEKARGKGMVREAVAKLGSTKVNGDVWLQDVFSDIANLVVTSFLSTYKPERSKSNYDYFSIDDYNSDVFLQELKQHFKTPLDFSLIETELMIQEAADIAEEREMWNLQDFLADLLEKMRYSDDAESIIDYFITEYPIKTPDGALKKLSEIATNACIKHKTEGSKFLYLLD